MTEVTFYAHFLKCITLNVSTKYSTVKVVKSVALKIKSLALKVRSLLTSLVLGLLRLQAVHYNSVGLIQTEYILATAFAVD